MKEAKQKKKEAKASPKKEAPATRLRDKDPKKDKKAAKKKATEAAFDFIDE